MLKRPFLALFLLAACGDGPGPSVAMQPGMTLSSANAAIRECAPDAPAGGKGAVVGSYVAGVVLGGIVVGPLIVAGNEDNIRAQGEAGAVDRCLAKRGFQRRDLTPAEFGALNGRSPAERQRLLNHLITGGTLETYSAT
jgi:hypothetical protein